MSKFNPRKTGFDTGIIAGKETQTAGKYTPEQLLRRVTLVNLLNESSFYDSADEIQKQMEELIKICDPTYSIRLAIECRNEQKLRHTPLWMLSLINKIHGVSVEKAIEEMHFRPDMVLDMLKITSIHRGNKEKIRNIPQNIRRGLKAKLSDFGEYNLGKYKRSNLELSMVDAVNILHPKSTPALDKLMKGTLPNPNTWEAALSSGKDKKETFEKMIAEKSLGGLAILRNLRNMKEAGISRKLILEAISQVNSNMLLPLDFLKASKIMPEYTTSLNDAMMRSLADYKIPGTTILAIDVSGSMYNQRSAKSEFSRMQLAFALAAYGSYLFEDCILVFTAGNDTTRTGKHQVFGNAKGLDIFNHERNIVKNLGGGGIFTAQLCNWLKDTGLAKDADRLVVISDSQDIDVSRGSKTKPDTSPYDHSYIIDISSHRYGIKTGVWTAEITGWSDAIFKYITALESKQ